MRRLISLVPALLLLSLCPFCNLSARAEVEPVVGGSQVPRGRWPDVVAVMLRDGVCSGTLVAPDVVVTAAHCVEAAPYEVRIDTIDYGHPGGERIRVAWARAYPNWQQRYDIGVLMLESPSLYAKPRVVTSACTARHLLDSGRTVEIVGFGLASTDGLDDNTKLRQASVAITDPTCTLDPACNPAIAPHGEFMAGGNGADSCFGDSGGPVYINTQDGHGHALVGIVSRGLAIPAVPCGGGGVYVRIDKVISWIQSVTGRVLARTHCTALNTDEADDDSASTGGCSASAGIGIGAAIAMLLIAWLLARRDRIRDASDFEP